MQDLNEELSQKLITDFPLLFSEKFGDSLIGLRGFEIQKGWFDLVYNLSKKLSQIIDKMPPEEQDKYRAVQVKQKFASLRFYMSEETPEMKKLISQASKKAEETCELCGSKGSRQVIDHYHISICSACVPLFREQRKKAWD